MEQLHSLVASNVIAFSVGILLFAYIFIALEKITIFFFIGLFIIIGGLEATGGMVLITRGMSWWQLNNNWCSSKCYCFRKLCKTRISYFIYELYEIWYSSCIYFSYSKYSIYLLKILEIKE